LSTVIDQILTEDRLTRSLLDQLSAELGYAQSIARFRFETGTLLAAGPTLSAVDLATLTTLPPAPVAIR
jgi:hypothetical protein